MKHLRFMKLAIYELRTQRRMIALFAVVAFFLLFSSFCVFLTVSKLPKDLEEYAEKRRLLNFSVEIRTKEEWGRIASLPINGGGGYFLDGRLQEIRIDGISEGEDAELGLIFYPENRKNVWMDTMDRYMLEGRAPESGDALSDRIWLKRKTATELGVSIGSLVYAGFPDCRAPFLLTGILEDSFDEFDAWLPGETVWAMLAGTEYEPIADVCYTIHTENSQQFFRVLSKIRAERIYILSVQEDFMKSIRIIRYAVFAAAFLVFLLLFGLTYDMMRFYHQKRLYYFAVLKAQGLSRRCYYGLLFFLFFCVYAAAALPAILLSPAFLANLERQIEEQIPYLDLTFSVWSTRSLLFFGAVVLLIAVSCLPSARQYDEKKLGCRLNEDEG
ncbi:MAG: hypothetical protein IK125_05385 [Lachnospiraceae bacterium]|nr:hypothetical protein [Lachnospiraceae bacterium]